MPGESILIVDDEVDVLHLCERILQSEGYRIETASNGSKAIELAREQHFDLLLTDIKMPGLTGLDIAQALKQSDPNVICVTMTGYSTMDLVLDALKLGIDEFILKPFTPTELTTAVAKTLEKVRLRKENLRLRSLIPLFELNKTLMGTVEVEKVLHRLFEISQRETKADFAGLYIFKNGEIIPRFLSQEVNGNPDLRHALDELAGLIFQTGQQITFSQADINSDHYATIGRLNIQSAIATPLKAKETNLGALILGGKESDFASSDSDFLAVLSGQAGIALENARLFTEIQEAYKELQILDHMKSEFINIAAHELRTPLAILVGYVNVLEEEVSGPSAEYVSIINRNAMRLRSLIEDLLNLKYLESGVISSLAHNRLNLQEVMQEVMEDMSMLADEKGLTLSVDIPADFPTIIADRQKFDLIIVNLLHNAIKFTPAPGQIAFSARVNADRAVMTVSDTGIGIPEDKINRIFDRFYQVEESLTREYKGMGLGLAIVRGMLEICGGDIHVVSKEDEGTTFTFTLPLDNSHLERRPLKL